MDEKETIAPVTDAEERETVVNAPPEEWVPESVRAADTVEDPAPANDTETEPGEPTPESPASDPDTGGAADEVATVAGVEKDQFAPVSTLDDLASAEQLSLEDKATDEDSERARLRAIVEAVVYVTEEPLTTKQIAEALVEPVERVGKALDEIAAEFDQPGHGLTVRKLAEGYMMGTKAEHHEAIRVFVKKLQKPLKLSMAALETLAVVAYKQPITAPEIMEIRGVQGAGVLKTLLDRRLVVTAGRKSVIGKPILYKTTKDFLVQFGLKNLKELPTLKEFEELARIALADAEEPEGPADRESGDAATDSAGERPTPDTADGDEPVADAGDTPEDAPDATEAPESEEGAEPESEDGKESAATEAEPIGPKSETAEVEAEDEKDSRTASED